MEESPAATRKIDDFLTPASFVRAARAAHPAFRYAVAVAGILAIIVTFARFGISYATLTLGVVVMIGLMALFLVFAQASKLARSRLDLPATVLIWAFLVIGIAVSLGLVTSVFFNFPLPFRDFLIEKMPSQPITVVPRNGATASNAGTEAIYDSPISGEKAVVVTELKESYLATGRLLAFFEDWGQTDTRRTLRVSHGLLTGTALDGRTVSISVDPKQLPIPQHTSQIPKMEGKDSEAAVRFFSSYEQFRESLVQLNSDPPNFLVTFTEATEFARETTIRGHTALCLMGMQPPRMFPSGGFLEPMPPNCSTSPFPPDNKQP